jgi:hypothetical protein
MPLSNPDWITRSSIFAPIGRMKAQSSLSLPKSLMSIPKALLTTQSLLGLCRLRIPDYEFTEKERIPHHYLPIYRNKADRISRIRELHVYGNIASSSKSGNSQHRGVGKFLISVAEAISRMYSCDIVTIISGVGVRDYYEHLGYALDSNEDQFMFKYLGAESVKPMVLFGKEYDYSKIEELMHSSIISLKYINPLFKTMRTANTNTRIEYDTRVPNQNV